MDHILIEGFIGCGKGAVGTKLSEEMNIPLVDTDSKVAEKMKMTPEEIYDKFGEVYFRALESFILGKLLRMRKRSIIVLGSGLPTFPENASVLKNLGRVYYLKANEDSIKKNIEKNHEKAWLEDDDDLNEKVEELLSEREPYYLDVADVIIKTGRKNTATIATEILNDVVKWDKERTIGTADESAEEASEEKSRKTSAKKKTTSKAKKTEEKKAEDKKAEDEEEKTKKKAPAKKKNASKTKKETKKEEKPDAPEDDAKSEKAGKSAKAKKAPAKKKTASKTEKKEKADKKAAKE